MSAHIRYSGFETGVSGSGFPAADVELSFIWGSRPDIGCELFNLPGLAVTFGRDTCDRVAFVALRGDHTVITIPATEKSTIFLGGEPVGYGRFACHQPGDRFHERSAAGTDWVRLFVPADVKLMTAKGDVVAVPAGQFPIRHVEAADMRIPALLTALRLATQTGGQAASDLSAGMPGSLREKLAACFLGARMLRPPAAARRRNDIMLRFQDFMALWCERQIHIPDICEALSVPARTLEDYCQAQCGVSAYRLLRLFRLKQVYAALEAATTSTDSVTAASRRFGFMDLGRFAATYRAAFQELPSQTLARAPAAFPRRADHAKHDQALAAG